MSNTIESKGRSVEEAISEALLQTGWRRDEVDVTVLEQPRSGFLGLIGGKQAKVRVERKGGGERRGRRDDARFDEPRGDRRGGGRDRDRGRDRDQRGGRPAETRGAEARPAPGRAPEAAGAEPRASEGRRDGGRGEPRGGRDRDQRGGRGRDRDRPRQETPARGPAATVEPVAGQAPMEEEGGRSSSSRRRRRRPTRQRDESPATTPLVETDTMAAAVTATEDQRDERPVAAEPQPAPAAVSPSFEENEAASRPAPAAIVDEPAPAPTPVLTEYTTAASERAKPYGRPATMPTPELLQTVTTDLMRLAGFPCRCEVREGEYDLVKLIVEDRSAHVLVGRYGAAVDAIEHLVEKVASQAAGDRVRMNLDVNNYRRRREEHLVQVARGAVREVRETGEPIHLDPLCARERRIVHLQVMDIPGMATYTVQDENGKHVVIATEEHVRAAAEAAGDAHLSHESDAHAEDLHGEGGTGDRA